MAAPIVSTSCDSINSSSVRADRRDTLIILSRSSHEQEAEAFKSLTHRLNQFVQRNSEGDRVAV